MTTQSTPDDLTGGCPDGVGHSRRWLPRRWPGRCLLAGCLLACCLLAGCQQVPSHQGALERKASHAAISSHQLRVMVNEFIVFFADRVEVTADQMLSETTDPAIRKNALRWKINGIAACFQAGSRPDPLGAFLDIWILNRQMMHLFASPAAGELFGPWQPLAIQECAGFEQRLQHIYQVAGSDLPLGEPFVAAFAADFPLNSLYFDREPIASRYIEQVEEPARELFHVVARLEQDLEELQKLSNRYAAHLPKQARWEVELLLIDITQVAAVAGPLRDLRLASESIARISATTEILPQLAAEESGAMRQLVSQERERTLADVEAMRRDTLRAFQSERAIVLEAFRGETAAALDALHNERLAVTSQMDDQLDRALLGTDEITHRRTQELAVHAADTIDHLLWRLCQAVATLAVLATIGWGLWRRSARLASRQAARVGLAGDVSPGASRDVLPARRAA